MNTTVMLKKWLFFIPAIVFTFFYGWLALDGIGAIHPVVFVWLALFWISGILLSKTVLWGGLFGAIPGIYFVYMGTQEAGQIISETPIGVVVLLYFAMCTYCVYKMKQKIAANKPKL